MAGFDLSPWSRQPKGGEAFHGVVGYSKVLLDSFNRDTVAGQDVVRSPLEDRCAVPLALGLRMCDRNALNPA